MNRENEISLGIGYNNEMNLLLHPIIQTMRTGRKEKGMSILQTPFMNHLESPLMSDSIQWHRLMVERPVATLYAPMRRLAMTLTVDVGLRILPSRTDYSKLVTFS
eukprot:c48690_g1_i1 orf=515-829(+)